MKLPLIAACLIAGSTWSFASADALASTSNQKTATRPYSAQAAQSTRGAGTSTKAGAGAQKQANGQRKLSHDEQEAQYAAQKEAQYPQVPQAHARTAQDQADAQQAADKEAQNQRQQLEQKQALIKAQTLRKLAAQGWTSTTGSGASSTGGSQPNPMLVAAPPNDDCSAAILVVGAGPFPTDTTAATTSAQQGGTCGTSTLDIWYSWVAPSTGNCTMSLCAGTAYDSIINVYTGAGCPAGAALACNDDFCAPLSSTTFAVTSGTTYTLQVGGWSGNFGPSSFTMTVVVPPPPPANDDCTAPTVLGAVTGVFPFDNTTATTSASGQTEVPCAADFGSTAMVHDVWYGWTAPFTGIAQFDTCSLGTVDTKIAAYPGSACPVAGTALACDDDTSGCTSFTSKVQFPVTTGSNYMLQIGTYPTASGGSGSFSLTQFTILPLDDCSLPSAITGAGPFAFDTTTMTTSVQQGGPCGTSGQDMWFDWTAPSTGNCTMSLCGGTVWDTLIKVYAGAGCPSGASIACDDDSVSCGLTSELVFACTAGSHYMLQVGGFGANFGTGAFTMTVAVPVALDDCSLPAAISGPGPFAFDTSGMTTSPQQGACGTSGQDMWFDWTATATGNCEMSLCGTGWDTLIAAYAGSGCPAGAAITCNDDSACSCIFTLQSTMIFPVTAGSHYMLQVGGFGANFGPGSFTMTIIGAPANDGCATPTTVAGFGTFPFDNRFATTGVDGQAEPLCLSFSSTVIDSDLWYSWTAPSSVPVGISTCGGTVDTKIAVYSGVGCPVAGTAVACNDDNCGFQSQLVFPATAGTTYTIQLGTFPGAAGGACTFDVVNATPPANDGCAASALLTGTGAFGFDNTWATTGVEGQSETLCTFYSSTTIDNDVWYSWVSPAAGCTQVSTCGGTIDSKIAIYSGAGCPVTGTAIACNDDYCGFQSTASFTATAGTTYTIQLGNFPGAGGQADTLTISQVPAGVGNDECSAATVVTGTGSFVFDNSLATTGCEGQSEALCNFFSTTAIGNDIWYRWTAPTTGKGVFSTCGSAMDSKSAAYLGAGCPTPGTALACNDDACASTDTKLVWDVTAGTVYTIQLGNYFGATPGPGVFTLDVLPPPLACDPLDDGSVETIFSLNGGGPGEDFVWLNRFGEPGVTTTINSVDMLYGILAAPGISSPDGTVSDILIYADDVSQDGDPSVATLLATIPSTVSLTDTDTYVNTVLGAPITVTGYFFVGGHQISLGLGLGCASCDRDSIWNDNRGWGFGDYLGGVADLANPGLSQFPPISLSGIGGGNWCVRVHCSSIPAVYLCTPPPSGPGSCPCSNPPVGTNRGCNNLSGTGGASITAFGTHSLATPTLFFVTAGENPTVASIMLQGTATISGATFGHGVRCVGGSIHRLYAKVAAGGSVTMPVLPTDPNIPARSFFLGDTITAGTKRWYMVYYRDSTTAMPGCPALNQRFNGTNTAEVTWNL